MRLFAGRPRRPMGGVCGPSRLSGLDQIRTTEATMTEIGRYMSETIGLIVKALYDVRNYP